MEIAQTIDNALEEYYSEKGQPVPSMEDEEKIPIGGLNIYENWRILRFIKSHTSLLMSLIILIH